MLHISLICSNHEYMNRLDHVIQSSEWREQVRLHRYTSISSFVEAGQHRYDADTQAIVLIEEGLRDSVQQEADANLSLHSMIVSLTADSRSASDDAIYMYQPVSRMMRRIMGIVTAAGHPKGHDGTESRYDKSAAVTHSTAVIAVTSPYGGSGVTTVSRLLAQQLAKRYSRVLYLNMELYPKQLHIPEVAHDFSRFLYMLTTRPDELSATWTQYCGPLPDQTYAFVPPSIKRNMRDMKPEYINLITDCFRELAFQAIVVDLDAHWLDDLIDGRISCDECWVIVPWKHRRMIDFPELRSYLQRPNVKLIANRTDAQDGSLTDIETKGLEADALLPYAASARLQQEEVFADDRLIAMIGRTIRESAVLGGAADDG